MEYRLRGNPVSKDYIEKVHVHTHSSSLHNQPITDLINSGLYVELMKFNFEHVEKQYNEFTEAEALAAAKALSHAKVFVTVHHLGQVFNMAAPGESVQVTNFKCRPDFNQFDYANNGKMPELQIRVMGVPNSGKTTIANMVVKVLRDINPTIEAVLVDTDPYSLNFYYLDDAGRAQFLERIASRVKINVGKPLCKGA